MYVDVEYSHVWDQIDEELKAFRDPDCDPISLIMLDTHTPWNNGIANKGCNPTSERHFGVQMYMGLARIKQFLWQCLSTIKSTKRILLQVV